MGGCLILESIALFNWCTKMGFGPICITGISMGGHVRVLVVDERFKYSNVLVHTECSPCREQLESANFDRPMFVMDYRILFFHSRGLE